MTLPQFLNAYLALRRIARHQLVAAGVIAPDDGAAWQRFRSNPVDFLAQADGDVADRVWGILECGHVPTERRATLARFH